MGCVPWSGTAATAASSSRASASGPTRRCSAGRCRRCSSMPEAVNPFADAIAIANSNYAAPERGRLVHPASGEPVSTLTAFVHDELRALVLNERFTCMGGKAAIRQGTYRFGLYGDMTLAAAASGLARDLFTFAGDMRTMVGGFTT